MSWTWWHAHSVAQWGGNVDSMAVCMHKIAKADFEADSYWNFYTKLTGMIGLCSAFQCWWTAIDARQYVKVRSIYSCCECRHPYSYRPEQGNEWRLLMLHRSPSDRFENPICWCLPLFPFQVNFDRNEAPLNKKRAAQMTKYFDDQANTLKNLDKETCYKDIDERLKIPMPPSEVTYYFWAF